MRGGASRDVLGVPLVVLMQMFSQFPRYYSLADSRYWYSSSGIVLTEPTNSAPQCLSYRDPIPRFENLVNPVHLPAN